AFSVASGIPLPPSLRNIFQEVAQDLGVPAATDGDLSRWARQGVMLLNATLTVREHSPKSHAGIGWNLFTDATIRTISRDCNNVVFILWGSDAISKRTLIDSSRHLILTAPHPSPLSAYRGFFGCRHFSKANEYLMAHGKTPINW
ncbi:MAG: uracil-DNA glycosylase, partial [Muribaculaceae bacterium]|nr:uracil-DNA glycosylase [Muribaculaceae bacterium]